MKSYIPPQFTVERDDRRCNMCRICVEECSFGVHYYDEKRKTMRAREERCVGCHRCSTFCPTRALTIRTHPAEFRPNANWRPEFILDIKKQAETGGIVLTGMGCDKPYRIYWDHLVLNASQVTNPSIDPLREPMELRTYLGARPSRFELTEGNWPVGCGEMDGTHTLHGTDGVHRIGADDARETSGFDVSPDGASPAPPPVRVEVPILLAAMSFGAVSFQVHRALMQAAQEVGTLCNTGEGGWPAELRGFGRHVIVQCASGRFGVDADYLNEAAIVEIKIGQGAKPGIGGHLPGEKVTEAVAKTRMIPPGTDALSPAPQHDIYSIEDLATLIYALKEATNYEKPVAVKIAAVHNAAAIASGIVRAGADIVVLDGFRGGTGAAPKIIRDNVGIPIELALASADARLRAEGIRHKASIIASGGFRNSADVLKAIALGADAVYIGTASLIAMGCTLCQQCYTGKCAWGIAASDPKLAERLDPEVAARRVVNLINGWSLEMKEMLGGMGINAIESLRGNRLHLRGIGLEDWELEVLGVRGAGT
ncbi:MAG: 4Fe-4S dicluster domain-containing protein [Firmicutes bacterium]|nr:4Fe-4S dicluster domain-containing protein [Bacillota bacterium]